MCRILIENKRIFFILVILVGKHKIMTNNIFLLAHLKTFNFMHIIHDLREKFHMILFCIKKNIRETLRFTKRTILGVIHYNNKYYKIRINIF